MDGKGKSTTMPSFRFHANAEELEQLYISDSDTEKDISQISDTVQTLKSSECKESPKREASPMKDMLALLSKRSQSVDTGIACPDSSPVSSASDRWRLFSGIKGKFAKTVEEKFTEIKSVPKNIDQEKDPEDAKQPNSKDNSSVSDSEDVSTSESFTSKFADIEMSSTNGIEDEVEILPVVGESSKPVDKNENNHVLLSPKTRQRINPKSFNAKNSDKIIVHFKNEKIDAKVSLPTEQNIDNAVEASEYAFSDDETNKNTSPSDEKPLELEISQQPYTIHPVQKTESEDSIYMSLSQNKYTIIFVIMLSIYLMTLSDYMNGFIVGAFAMYCITIIKDYFSPVRERSEIILPIIYQDSPMPIKEYEPEGHFEGWMNEYPKTYNVLTYHINDTISTWVSLDGCVLKLLSGETVKVPKRQMWNEKELPPISKLPFTKKRIINMHRAKITLLPNGLTKKRFWSKKYPICIEVKETPEEHKLTPVKIEHVIEQNDSFHSNDNISLSEDKPRRVSLTKSDGLPSIDEETILSQQEESASSISPLNESIQQESSLFYDCDSSYSANPTITGEDTYMESLWENTEDNFDEENTYHIYLFARTGREKEEWFNRFVNATKYGVEEHPSLHNIDEKHATQSPDNSLNTVSFEDYSLSSYRQFMAKFKRKEKIQTIAPTDILEVDRNIMWVNALIGRILFDAVRLPEWQNAVKQRIQRKLSSIKLPYFMEELIITDLDLGVAIPIICQASSPNVDERGLWIDLNVVYEGCISATLTTKLNLMKLKKDLSSKTKHIILEPTEHHKSSLENPEKNTSGEVPEPVYNSDVDDSAESSSDEDSHSNQSTETSGNTAVLVRKSSKKILRMVDKIASSKYFQQATEYKYVKRAMEGVSRTELKLCVEIRGISGPLALNIPPPPSHRLWFGFKTNPKLFLHAKPIVGERSLNFNHVTSWIEKKLKVEFQKVFVLPNMEDIVIPFMNNNLAK